MLCFPFGTLQDELRHFFAGVMMSSGALISPGPAIISCKITPDKGYAFLEMRSVEEASNAMAFDGIQLKDANLKVRPGGASNQRHTTCNSYKELSASCKGSVPHVSYCLRAHCCSLQQGLSSCTQKSVRHCHMSLCLPALPTHSVPCPSQVRRPSNYDANTAIMLGPVTPDPTMDTSTLNICKTVVEDSWNKIFIGGLPSDWGDEQVGVNGDEHLVVLRFDVLSLYSCDCGWEMSRRGAARGGEGQVVAVCLSTW